MAKHDTGIRMMPSVLDRLSDDGANAVDYQSVAQLKRVVARDLEALLNARQELLTELDPAYVESAQSSLRFGLPDFSALNMASQQDRNQVRRAVESALASFEPRITRPRVTVDEPRGTDRGLRFHIEAMLRVEPTPLPVAFDAMLQPRTQQYEIKES